MSAIGTRSEFGTTLVELLVVLVILAMVMSTGLMAMGTLEERRLDREANQVSEWLKTVRREAMLRGVVYQVRTSELRLDTSPSLGLLVRNHSRRVQISVESDNSVWSAPCFFPDGSACPGHFDLRGGSGKRRLSVGWLGDVTLQRIE